LSLSAQPFRLSIIWLFFLYSPSVFTQTIDSVDPHPPSRVNAGLGNSIFGNFLEFQYRPYSHDLLNSDKGYVPFSESGKFNTTVRYYQETQRLEISKFSVIKLMSLTPYNSLTDTKSYGLDLGLESVTVKDKRKLYDSDKDDKKRITPINGDLLAGYTFENYFGSNRNPFIISLLGGMKTQIHPHFNEFLRVGPQAVFNVLYDLGIIKVQFISSYQYYTILKNANDFSNSLKFRFSIDLKQEIRLELNKSRFDQELNLSYLFMF